MCTQQFFTTVSEAPQEWDQCLIPFCGAQFVHTGLSKYLISKWMNEWGLFLCFPIYATLEAEDSAWGDKQDESWCDWCSS